MYTPPTPTRRDKTVSESVCIGHYATSVELVAYSHSIIVGAYARTPAVEITCYDVVGSRDVVSDVIIRFRAVTFP